MEGIIAILTALAAGLRDAVTQAGLNEALGILRHEYEELKGDLDKVYDHFAAEAAAHVNTKRELEKEQRAHVNTKKELEKEQRAHVNTKKELRDADQRFLHAARWR